jgi:hypothetical protein
MHSAVTPAFLPAQEQRREAREIAPPPEKHIRMMVATFASAIAEGILEHQQAGRMTKETARRGGDAMCELVPFKLCTPDFDAIARKYGVQALCEYVAAAPNGMVPNEEFIGRIVEQALAVLSDFVKRKIN